mmetsp:Transcript_25864/g.48722  ORF Transcript_25864/g.48722 Transcript_25864/m.48722 type:complete len:306 (-) Transcript_25864:1387-2304(-)
MFLLPVLPLQLLLLHRHQARRIRRILLFPLLPLPICHSIIDSDFLRQPPRQFSVRLLLRSRPLASLLVLDELLVAHPNGHEVVISLALGLDEARVEGLVEVETFGELRLQGVERLVRRRHPHEVLLSLRRLGPDGGGECFIQPEDAREKLLLPSAVVRDVDLDLVEARQHFIYFLINVCGPAERVLQVDGFDVAHELGEGGVPDGHQAGQVHELVLQRGSVESFLALLLRHVRLDHLPAPIKHSQRCPSRGVAEVPLQDLVALLGVVHEVLVVLDGALVVGVYGFVLRVGAGEDIVDPGGLIDHR